ncbi:MAG: hypothetical protein ACM3YF_01190 [Candidatus Zixiibacteriota bacterium]
MKLFCNKGAFLTLIGGFLYFASPQNLIGGIGHNVGHFPSKPAVGETLNALISVELPSTCWYGLTFDSTIIRDTVVKIFSTVHYSCPPICVCYQIVLPDRFETIVGSFSTPGNYAIVSEISVSPSDAGGPFIRTCNFTVEDNPFMDGDLNNDLLLSPSDVVLELLCIYFDIPPPTGLARCDLDGNSISSEFDAILLINAVFLDDTIWHNCSP